MTRFLTSIAAAIGRVVAPFRPTPGTTEGAVLLGLLGLAVGLFVLFGIGWALVVPSSLLVLIGSFPAVSQLRRSS